MTQPHGGYPIVECICGADIKPFTFEGQQHWMHVTSADDRCYPESPDPIEWEAKAEPLDPGDDALLTQSIRSTGGAE